MEKGLKTQNDTKYAALIQSIGELLSSARAKIATNVDSVMVQTYWSVGKYIVEFEQDGNEHAEYGSKLLHNLSRDLTLRYGVKVSAIPTSTKCGNFLLHFQFYRHCLQN